MSKICEVLSHVTFLIDLYWSIRMRCAIVQLFTCLICCYSAIFQYTDFRHSAEEIPGKGGERVAQHQGQTADEENCRGGTFEDAGEEEILKSCDLNIMHLSKNYILLRFALWLLVQ